ncbi:Uncharacterised protein [uncultured archaeon]|nr:Uncharacterised protein [uncultured archaeon]
MAIALVGIAGAAGDPRGTWKFNYYYGGNTYTHDMMITSFNPETGEFKGNGWDSDNPAITWDVSGISQINGWKIEFHIDYTGEDPDYWVDATGNFPSDTFMLGTAKAPGQSAEWDATKIAA